MKAQTSIKVKKVRNIEEMNSPETELPMRNTTPMMEGEALQLRRSLEYELIARCDKNKIDSHSECWYIMDCSWLDEWTSFIDGKTSSKIFNTLSYEVKDEEDAHRIVNHINEYEKPRNNVKKWYLSGLR